MDFLNMKLTLFGLVILVLAFYSQDTNAVRHCIYKFRVPASGLDISCPGSSNMLTSNNKQQKDYYHNDQRTAADDPAVVNRTPSSGKKKKQSNKKRSQMSHNIPPPANLVNDYSAADGHKTSTLYKTDNGAALLNEDTAQQIIQGMAKLVTHSNGDNGEKTNSKIQALETQIADQNKKYEELLVKTLQLSSQMHLLTSGIEHSTPPDTQPHLDTGPFQNYIGSTSKIACPVNHPKRIHKLTLIRQIFDTTIDVVPRSCYEWYKQGFTDSGQYKVDLDGLEGLPPITVTCIMDGKQPITAINHNYFERTWVNDYEEPGSYIANIKYNATEQHIDFLLTNSPKCEQHLKWECKGASIMFQSWWESRQGMKMDYWPGSNPKTGGCECYLDDRCKLGRRCNCDVNDGTRWLEDSGYVEDKSVIPVSKLRFGDTGGKDEEGYFTLGPLRCYTNITNQVNDVNAYLAVKTWPPISVFCDHDGWIVVQRKHANGKTSFDRAWDFYKNGFGDLKEEFWLGLDNLHKLTNQKWQPMVLQVVIELNNDIKMYATYEHFKIDSDAENFTIHIGKYTGSMPDALRFINGMQFTTKDRDNDRYTYGNCASVGGGGWWYTGCGKVHLNGYIMWADIEDAKTVHMKIRPMSSL